MTDSLIILGSTGSIGTQALEVCRHLGIRVPALAAGHNIGLLESQVRQWRPALVSVADAVGAADLKRRLAGFDAPVEITHGREGVLQAARHEGSGMVLAAMVGVAGLEPVMAAVAAGNDNSQGNKETLVSRGSLVMPLLKKNGRNLYPVDSEHSAIWQCLAGAPADGLKRIFLTASGGPFQIGRAHV